MFQKLGTLLQSAGSSRKLSGERLSGTWDAPSVAHATPPHEHRPPRPLRRRRPRGDGSSWGWARARQAPGRSSAPAQPPASPHGDELPESHQSGAAGSQERGGRGGRTGRACEGGSRIYGSRLTHPCSTARRVSTWEHGFPAQQQVVNKQAPGHRPPPSRGEGTRLPRETQAPRCPRPPLPPCTTRSCRDAHGARAGGPSPATGPRCLQRYRPRGLEGLTKQMFRETEPHVWVSKGWGLHRPPRSGTSQRPCQG